MKRFIVFAVAVMSFGFYHSASAQLVGNAGGQGFTFIDNELGSFHSGGIGVSFGGDYFIQPNIGIGVNLGGNYLFDGTDGDDIGATYLIPIQAQMKFFLTGDYEEGGFHITPQAGFQFLTIEISSFGGASQTYTNGGYGFGGRVGYQIEQFDIAATFSTGRILGDTNDAYTSVGLAVSYLLFR